MTELSKENKKKALITGATGTIGPTLASYLTRQGYDVRTLSRHHPASGLLPSGVTHFNGDITVSTSFLPVLEGVDTVFHLAALLHIENPSSALEAEYYRINVQGAEEVAKQARDMGIRRFIYFSTVKVYGIHQAKPVTEENLTKPQTFYAKSKLEGEQVIKNIAGIETIILRLSSVYGGRLQGAWRRLTKAAAQGWFIPFGSLENVRSLTHVDDVARAAKLVAECPEVSGQIYNVVGHETVTMYDILTAIYAALDKKLPPFRLPAAPIIGGIGLFQKLLTILGKDSPITSETIQQFVNDEVYSGQKLYSLGFKPQVTLQHGWAKTLNELKFKG